MRAPGLIRVLLLLAAGIAAAQPAASQPAAQRFGLWGALGADLHSAAITGLPGVPSCSPGYESGFGLAPSAGALYERPLGGELLGGELLFGLRAGWVSNGATLAVDERQTVAIDDAAVPVTIEYRIDAALGSLVVAPHLGWRATPRLTVAAGAEIGWLLAARFEQREQLSDADRRGRFENGRRVRNEAAGEIPEASTLQAALQIGAGYELPLDAAGRFSASPEIVASLALVPVIDGASWYAHQVRAGVALRWAPTSAPTPIAPVVVQAPEPARPELRASVRAAGLDAAGAESPVATMRVEELVASEARPLLGYVFFEEGSSEIPSRYRRGDTTFTPAALHGLDALEAYYSMLDVIGMRMREHPSARLRLTGTNAGSESGDRALSRRRAEAVRDDLRSRWGIEPSRLEIVAVDLPTLPSRTTTPEGTAENRRVEITSSDPAILSAVRTEDTMRATTPPSVRFHLEASGAQVRSWRVVAMQHGEVLRQFQGSGMPPSTLDWPIEREQSSVPRAPGVVHYRMTVEWASGEQTQTELAELPVEQVTIRRKRRDRVADVAIERYDLIHFGFDRAELGADHRRTLASIRASIAPDARVRVVGYTDATGDAEHNARLALDRARAVARELGVAEDRLEVSGATEPRFEQTLPEGRFHSRVVEIEIRTPVEGMREEG